MREIKVKIKDSITLTIFEHIIMYGWLILVLFPFLWMLSLSLRKIEETYTALFFPKEYTFENFIHLFEGKFPPKNIEIDFLGSMLNSLTISIISVALILIVSIITD